jgi:3-hydroxyacyl-[acyl-carrier protein] dehydratase / trans-2-decenoyl-[acyl-carrier protein] isomerase
MKYADYLERTTFARDEILAIAHGTLVEDFPGEMGKLPTPPLLMFDRVVAIERAGNRGRIVAELDVRLDAWYFQCHFKGDPVQPGCLGVDGVWQLLGLYLSVCGCPGTGRALGCKEIEFAGQIRPFDEVVRYDVTVRRLTRLKETGAALVIADATVAVDGEVIYTIAGAKVGTFLGITYGDYPNRSRRARGGIMRGSS